jgi:hypothetical protein
LNINDYRRGMDKIVPDMELKERIMNQTKRKHRSVRRVFTVALAATLTVTCLATVAFAASPELRAAVLSFFRMEEREQVPSSSVSPGGPDISQAEIGELVKAQYIKMDSYQYGFSGGLLHHLTWSEDRKTLLDAKFWEARDNELIPVDMHTSQVDIMFKGLHYQGKFWWFIHEGQLDYFTADNRAWDEEGEHAWDWNFSQIPGRNDALLLRLSTGTQMEYREYPLLYHLDTGETEELFAGVDPAVLAESDGAVWSDNFQMSLITGRASAQFPNGQEWLYDRKTQTLTDVRTLGGMGADMAAFADDDTLILYDSSYDENDILQAITFYAYDIPSGRVTKTLDQTPYYRDGDENPNGVMTFGSRCVLISEEGQVQVVDLKTGDRTLLGGFTFRNGDSFQLNPSGNKLLYFARDTQFEGLGISQIGVADLEKGVFFAFDREGYENLDEGGIGWDDDNTVSIRARTLDNETHYLLVYQF